MTQPIPYHYLGPTKRNQPTNPARALVRDTIAAQRHRWANQIGEPPRSQSRSGLPWEPWEHDLLRDNRDTMTVNDLAIWTGRTTDQIHQQFNDYDMMADDQPDDFDFDDDNDQVQPVVVAKQKKKTRNQPLNQRRPTL